jgi:hypothetical protein
LHEFVGYFTIMWKVVSIILFLAFTYRLSVAQQKWNSLANSRLFVNGDYINDKNDYKYIAVNKFLLDTVIKDVSYRKYEWITFTDFSLSRDSSYYYETWENQQYKRIGEHLETIHEVDVATTSEQQGILHGKNGSIAVEFFGHQKLLSAGQFDS